MVVLKVGAVGTGTNPGVGQGGCELAGDEDGVPETPVWVPPVGTASVRRSDGVTPLCSR